MHKGAVGVVIGTTEGPSEVLRIAVEAPGIHSVVCLGMSTEALAISPAYDAFVRRPTGVVERELGHSSYRADVSARIDNGSSWQLGLYLAHKLMAEGRLASPKDMPDQWIWVSGTLDTDMVIGPVTGVERKLERSRDWFAERSAEGRAVTIVVPEQSANVLEGAPTGVAALAKARVIPVLAYLGLDMPGVDAPGPTTPDVASTPVEEARVPKPERSMSRVSAMLVFLFLLIGAGMAVWLVDPALFHRAVVMVSTTRVEPAPSVAPMPNPVPVPAPAPAAAPAAAPVPAPTVMPNPVSVAEPKHSEEIEASEPASAAIPELEIAWAVGRAINGERCGGDLAYTPFKPGRQTGFGPICQVAMSLSNRSSARASVDATAGILGRPREYMRKSRHVARERTVLYPGDTVRITLDIPVWIRGEIQVRAVALASDPAQNVSGTSRDVSALELITTPPLGPGVSVSTIKVN